MKAHLIDIPAGTKVNVICRGQGQILSSHFSINLLFHKHSLFSLRHIKYGIGGSKVKNTQ